ncbi:ribonuclease [Tsuneonella sp. HG094]
MAEWLVESGIGEERALLYDGDRVVAAKMRWPESLEAGMVEDAVLVRRPKGSPRGIARFANGEDALVDRLPASAAEGSAIRLQVHRAAVTEPRRRKLAQARPSDNEPRPAPSLVEALAAPVRSVRSFPAGDWEDLWQHAWDASVEFSGGTLWFAPTAAMTLIDIDGALALRDLARAAVLPVTTAIRRFDLGGSIGIDFPALDAKADRRSIDEALDAALDGWPHERTAMNGFGFVQIVARREGPSLLHRLAFDRTGAAARLLLRRAERIEGAGAILLSAHSAVLSALHPDWLGELARRAGREIRTVADHSLAFEASLAQIVPR